MTETHAWRLRHVTTYAYGDPVDMAMHMTHLTPRDVPGRQAVRHATLSADPQPTRRSRGRDHFGNDVTWIFLDRPHKRFTVTTEAEVVVTAPPRPEAAATPAWEALAAPARRVPEVAEFLFPSPMLPADAGARDYVRESFAEGRPVMEGLLELLRRFRADFAFRAGVTSISTPVGEVLRRRAGVCQDFAHLAITGLRGLGIPARYMSGYIRTRPPPGGTAQRGVDQSHAWVAAWAGPETGWVEIDPTNDLVVRTEHAVLGWGRDFGDVSPLLGIILGGGKHVVTVGVDMDEAA